MCEKVKKTRFRTFLLNFWAFFGSQIMKKCGNKKAARRFFFSESFLSFTFSKCLSHVKFFLPNP